MATIYYTGCSLDAFIAPLDHDLTWLTSRTIDPGAEMGFDTFSPRVGAAVMGASTWQWLQDNGEEKFMDGTPTVVLTHRTFTPADDVNFVAADDAESLRRVHADLVNAAGEKDVWVVGGGPVAATFADLGLVDEFWVQFAPVTLGAGQPLCPTDVELALLEVVRNGDFVCTRYAVSGPR